MIELLQDWNSIKQIEVSMEFRDGTYKSITYIFYVILYTIHFKLTSLDVILRQFKFEIAKF
jgi:hypothetical protein